MIDSTLYHLTEQDLDRIVNEAAPATELGWAVKDLLLAHYEMEGMRDEIKSLKVQLDAACLGWA